MIRQLRAGSLVTLISFFKSGRQIASIVSCYRQLLLKAVLSGPRKDCLFFIVSMFVVQALHLSNPSLKRTRACKNFGCVLDRRTQVTVF